MSLSTFGTAYSSRIARAVSHDGDRLSEAGLRSLFSQPERAASLGRRYLSAFPEERDTEKLRGALSESLRPGRFDATTDFDSADPLSGAGAQAGEALRARLAQVRRDDFRSGNVVELNGWIVSRSELRLCAWIELA
jgi:hypothetical protein